MHPLGPIRKKSATSLRHSVYFIRRFCDMFMHTTAEPLYGRYAARWRRLANYNENNLFQRRSPDVVSVLLLLLLLLLLLNLNVITTLQSSDFKVHDLLHHCVDETHWL